VTTRSPVLIVDDHPLVREGLGARISAQPDMRVCGEAAGVDEALALVDTTAPELVIVDLALKDGHGLNLIKKVIQRSPTTKVLVVSAYDDALFAERALRAGALGYINKQEAQNNVIEALRTVLRGGCYLSAEMTRRLVKHTAGRRTELRGIEGLSDRELEVFEQIGRGKSTRSIAQHLHLSIHTIESYRENIRDKLALRDGAELVQQAVQWVLEMRGTRS